MIRTYYYIFHAKGVIYNRGASCYVTPIKRALELFTKT